MFRKSHLFSNRKHTEKGIFGTALGVISILSILISIQISYVNDGLISTKLGAAMLFVMIFSIVGEVVSVLSRMQKECLHFFSNLGILFNAIAIIGVVFIVCLGVWG